MSLMELTECPLLKIHFPPIAHRDQKPVIEDAGLWNEVELQFVPHLFENCLICAQPKHGNLKFRERKSNVQRSSPSIAEIFLKWIEIQFPITSMLSWGDRFEISSTRCNWKRCQIGWTSGKWIQKTDHPKVPFPGRWNVKPSGKSIHPSKICRI